MADLSWTEPESAANTDYQPIYPYNNIQQTESGHFLEMDDTPTRERVRLQHRSGTFIEMHPNGDEVHKVYGNGYEITIQDKNVLIKGVCNITVQGDSVFHVQGDSYNQVDGNVYQTVKGDLNQVVEGNCEQTVNGDFDFNAQGDFNISAANVNVNADLNVNGDIGTNQTVAAIGNITSQMQVSAAIGIQTTGFINAGVPTLAALPGTITSSVSVNSPIINDYIGTLESVRIGINAHVHPGVQNGLGVTGIIATPIL